MADEPELPRVVGSTAEDIRGFIVRYQASYGGNAIDEFRVARCECGAAAFYFRYDPDGGAAERLCPECDRTHLMCDSEGYWEPERAADWDCRECGGRSATWGSGSPSARTGRSSAGCTSASGAPGAGCSTWARPGRSCTGRPSSSLTRCRWSPPNPSLHPTRGRDSLGWQSLPADAAGG
jgi:hypothetical protein